MPVSELCRKHGMSDATFYSWLNNLDLYRFHKLLIRRLADA
jgi:hypothetical protein